jgi:molybdate transport system ATP-binding protein
VLNAHVEKALGPLSVDADLRVDAGETLVLVGENGSGKTTILHMLAGLLDPDGGRIELDGEVLFDRAQGRSVAAFARPIGFVFQDYALFPHLSVFENVAFAMRAQHLSDSATRARTQTVLDQVGIARLAARKPLTLSGGESQRVALARALAAEPRLLLLDEPLAALDQQTRAQVRTELRRRLEALTCATILVTHNPLEALLFGDRIAVLEHGRIVQTGRGEDLLRHPRSGYVAGLMGLNFFHGRVVAREAGGLVIVDTPQGPLRVAGPMERDDVFLVVDPREITLHLAPPSGSAQNVFPGPIVELVPEPPFGDRVRVGLGTKPPLVAEVTRHAVETLGLREGTTVYASVKATAARAYG